MLKFEKKNPSPNVNGSLKRIKEYDTNFARNSHETGENAHEIRVEIMMSRNNMEKYILENNAKINMA